MKDSKENTYWCMHQLMRGTDVRIVKTRATADELKAATIYQLKFCLRKFGGCPLLCSVKGLAKELGIDEVSVVT